VKFSLIQDIRTSLYWTLTNSVYSLVLLFPLLSTVFPFPCLFWDRKAEVNKQKTGSLPSGNSKWHFRLKRDEDGRDFTVSLFKGQPTTPFAFSQVLLSTICTCPYSLHEAIQAPFMFQRVVWFCVTAGKLQSVCTKLTRSLNFTKFPQPKNNQL